MVLSAGKVFFDLGRSLESPTSSMRCGCVGFLGLSVGTPEERGDLLPNMVPGDLGHV